MSAGTDRGGAGGNGPGEAARPAVRSQPDYAPAVYGSLLTTTLIAVQWRGEVSAEFVAFSLGLSVTVFWLTHVWSEVVSRRVHGPIGRTGVAAIAVSEATMLTAAVVPVLLLVLVRWGVYPVDTGLAVALAASIVQLFLWGLAVGRAAHATWLGALAVAGVDCALGLVIVALKVIAIH